jgi:hypothetical protein
VVAIIREGQAQMFNTNQDVKLRKTDRVVVVRALPPTSDAGSPVS